MEAVNFPHVPVSGEFSRRAVPVPQNQPKSFLQNGPILDRFWDDFRLRSRFAKMNLRIDLNLQAGRGATRPTMRAVCPAFDFIT